MDTLKKPPQDVNAHIQQRFGQTAANYRASKVHAAGPDLDQMIQIASPCHDDPRAGRWLWRRAYRFGFRQTSASLVIACDFTPAMLDQAAMLARDAGIDNLITQLANVENLPFPDMSFDLVVTRYSAHHWRRPERALAEFRRLLKKDGALLISDIMAREDYAQDTFLQTIELLRDPSHVRDFRQSEWRDMLAQARFDSEPIMTFDLALRFDVWTRRMNTPDRNANMIKALFNGASADIKRAFRLPARVTGDDFEFVIPGALIRASPAGT